MNKFIMADPNRCIGCRTCELACAIAHGNGNATSISTSSFCTSITLIKEADITVPVVCKQCEDAPCANACPTGALVKANGLVEVHEAHCIGCKSCVLACPFGVIEISMKGTKAQINKCDLCVDQATGPACITACPTNALTLFDQHQLAILKQEKLQRTAIGANSHLIG
jgi:electron transport protein HydN